MLLVLHYISVLHLLNALESTVDRALELNKDVLLIHISLPLSAHNLIAGSPVTQATQCHLITNKTHPTTPL